MLAVEALAGWIMFGGAFLNWFNLRTIGCSKAIWVLCPPSTSSAAFLGTWFALGLFALTALTVWPSTHLRRFLLARMISERQHALQETAMRAVVYGQPVYGHRCKD
eukprot:TRINITY_DN218_c0_g1_i5.p1 TRINITY_DN218_c0_g1~~TRINITY_DN218_c0_g1_i5.p1  ORF type:complete len:106 (-),score=25.41 TRINITY_DN218_c0_g1_i5:463-780(-)